MNNLLGAFLTDWDKETIKDNSEKVVDMANYVAETISNLFNNK